jgi:hypothetical protein
VHNYEKSGFYRHHYVVRYSSPTVRGVLQAANACVSHSNHISARAVTSVDVPAVVSYDARKAVTPVERSQLLQALLTGQYVTAMCCSETGAGTGAGTGTGTGTGHGQVCGYGVIRGSVDGSVRVGPLVADSDSAALAILIALLEGCGQEGGRGTLYIDIPEISANGTALAQQLGLTRGSGSHCLRMYTCQRNMSSPTLIVPVSQPTGTEGKMRDGGDPCQGHTSCYANFSLEVG